VGGVLIVEDVTQRALMERSLAVSERLAGVGRLAAMVAHEINNPLDGIMRLVNLARRAEAENEDPRADKYLAEADKGLLRLAAIVRDLLAFSQSATQVVEPMPIRDLLAEAAEAMQPAAEKAAVRIDVSCADDVPPVKSSTLYHVVLNLVKNAVEAMPDGGRVTVSARAEPQGLVVEVADTGSGIPPESLAKIFEPFYSHKAKGKGTGLGLVISKDLVEKQGGTLEAANRPEGGALFTVRVPLLAARPRDRR
jgi:signal transduction histidine kinase